MNKKKHNNIKNDGAETSILIGDSWKKKVTKTGDYIISTKSLKKSFVDGLKETTVLKC